MTTVDLARDYFKRCVMRATALKTLLDVGAYPDVVRESQELIELLLKGYLRLYKVDPPKWHDVSQLLLENSKLFPLEIQKQLSDLSAFSKFLRKERENSFYGEDDLIPMESYDISTATDCYQKVLKYIDLFKSDFEDTNK